jgi:hypothetical protein
MNLQITGLSTEALLSQLEFEELGTARTANALVKRVLKALAICPKTAILAKIGLEAIDVTSSSSASGITEALAAVLIDLKRHEKEIEAFSTKANRFTEWLKTDAGARVFRQSAGAADRTADPGKVGRIARLLLYGAVSSGRDEDDQLLVQQVSEFTRIAEILTDTDVLVLRAIYQSQRAVIEKYRELNGLGGDSQDRQLQDQWAQAVFAQWKETSFTDRSRFLRFIDVLSALPRLEAQGLIGRTTSQVVSADISSTPFGLLDLGALFVEQALKYDGRLEVEEESGDLIHDLQDSNASY